jgi:UDP-2-acetamido-2,6-beta-L-arabino-hexul-4-ose reductase
MKILVTGSKGFIGKNLISELENRGYRKIYRFDRETDKERLGEYTRDCDFVFIWRE